MRSGLLATAVLIPLMTQSAGGQHIWMHDEFASQAAGARWHMADTGWGFSPGLVRMKTSAYDRLLASRYYIYDAHPWSIEVQLRGERAGVFFSLDDTVSRALSHMVRFDGSSILSGHFDAGGEFTATGTFTTSVSTGVWTTLRVDVDPAGKRYSILVDGTLAGTDTLLTFPSGYFGLQASDGFSEFRSVTVSSRYPVASPPRARRGTPATFQHVRFVRAGRDNITIYNPDAGMFQALDMKGKLLSQQPGKRPISPGPAARRWGLVAVASRTGVSLTDTMTHASRTIPLRLVAPAALLIDADTALYIADAAERRIVRLNPDGSIAGMFDGKSVGGLLAPRGLDFVGDDRIVIADYNRLIVVDKNLAVSPLLHIDGPTRASARWRAFGTPRPFLLLSPDTGKTTRVEAVPDRKTGAATLTLSGLRPASRYTAMFSHACTVIPSSPPPLSRGYRFVTPPSDSSMMLYSRLPLLCMVYRTISYRDRYPASRYPLVPKGSTLSDDDIGYLKQACRFNTEFYFRNSACRLLLDFDFVVIDEPLRLSDLGEVDPYWLSPNDRVARDVEHAAASLGKKPTEYAGVVVPYVWVNYPARRTDPLPADSVIIRQAYGGGTLGVPAPWKFGTSAGFTSNPFPGRFSRQDWLITHEFHHQLDALLEASGYPEYYHADQPWKMPGRFGEDFDFNAAIVRRAPAEWWLTLKFGNVGQTKDADGDGLPDDDPSLPLDERRLGGNPGKDDTDGDGLNDLQEVMSGTSRGTDLNNADTDGDGLPDDNDPEPLYPIPPILARLQPGFARPIRPSVTMERDSLQAELYWWWNDRGVGLAVEADRPANVLLQIDATCDGWFHGSDNIQIRLARDSTGASVTEYYLRDCSSWSDPPKDRKDIYTPEDLHLSADRVGDSTQIRYRTACLVPWDGAHGFQPKAGTRLALRIGLQTTADRWVWEELFERNYMMAVELR